MPLYPGGHPVTVEIFVFDEFTQRIVPVIYTAEPSVQPVRHAHSCFLALDVYEFRKKCDETPYFLLLLYPSRN